MLDLASLPTSAAARLVRCAPRRDASGAIVWDVDLAVEITSDEDAQLVEAFVPGTVKQFTAGRVHASNGSAKVSGGFDVVRVKFSQLDGTSVASGHADIRSCSSNVKGENAVLVVRIRVHGLLPHAASDLAYCIDECVSVHIDEQGEVSRQGSVGDDLVGCVICTPDGFAGRVISHDSEGLLIDTLSVKMHIPLSALDSSDGPTSIVSICDDGLEDMLQRYVDAASATGLASWSHLLRAIGQLYARSEIEPSIHGFKITESVIEEALRFSEEDPAAPRGFHSVLAEG
tara:strand:+ start:482 stop:1342 length:861 start_codon:yes stop_codon:yes gene_type:complete